MTPLQVVHLARMGRRANVLQVQQLPEERAYVAQGPKRAKIAYGVHAWAKPSPHLLRFVATTWTTTATTMSTKVVDPAKTVPQGLAIQVLPIRAMSDFARMANKPARMVLGRLVAAK
jgi:hypothetical protein